MSNPEFPRRPDVVATRTEIALPSTVAPVPRLSGSRHDRLDSSEITPERRHELVAQALEHVGAGLTLSQIELATGIERTTIRGWMLSDVPEAYRAAQVAAHIANILETDKALADARDHVEITKAVAQGKFARHDAERRVGHLFGARQELTIKDITPPPDILDTARRVTFILNEQKRLAAKVGAPIDVTPAEASTVSTSQST